MTKNDIIKIATEVWGTPKWTEIQIIRLERFVNMAQAAEREACAKIADNHIDGTPEWNSAANNISQAIRARGNK